MRRAHPIRPENAWAEFQKLLRDPRGFELLLASLPPGSTIEDARRLHRKVAQQSRTPCSFLDAELGIERG